MSPALVLNANFDALAVVPLKRAVLLVLADKAEIVEAGDDEWRSANTAIPVPVVIRLRRYVRVPYMTRVPLTRRNLLARDHNRCAYCTKTATTIDHVHPRSKGGQHVWENVVAACARCNGVKDNYTLAELQRRYPGRWKLTFKPYAPTGRAWLVMGYADRDPSWDPYLGVTATLATV